MTRASKRPRDPNQLAKLQASRSRRAISSEARLPAGGDADDRGTR